MEKITPLPHRKNIPPTAKTPVLTHFYPKSGEGCLGEWLGVAEQLVMTGQVKIVHSAVNRDGRKMVLMIVYDVEAR